MTRKHREQYQPRYRVFIYRPHHSGIGSTFVKEVSVTEKPSFDNCDFFDETNRVWARWEHRKDV